MKQIYERKCSWCYFTNGKRERITQVYVKQRNPFVILFRTKSGAYVYEAQPDNTLYELPNVKPIIRTNLPKNYFYYLSTDTEIPLHEFGTDACIAINTIEKIELIDKHLAI